MKFLTKVSHKPHTAAALLAAGAYASYRLSANDRKYLELVPTIASVGVLTIAVHRVVFVELAVS